MVPVPLESINSLVLHVIPFSAFDALLELPFGKTDFQYRSFPTMARDMAQGFRINVDGLLTLTNPNTTKQKGYVQVFLSGIVEAVESFTLRGEGGTPRQLTSIWTEAAIVKS